MGKEICSLFFYFFKNGVDKNKYLQYNKVKIRNKIAISLIANLSNIITLTLFFPLNSLVEYLDQVPCLVFFFSLCPR